MQAPWWAGPGWYCRTQPTLAPGDKYPIDHPEWFAVVGPFRWALTARLWAWRYLISHEWGQVDVLRFDAPPDVASG